MGENNKIFLTGDKLLNAIESQTLKQSVKFHRRDFVEPLIKFCLDGNYTARIGILFGLQSTGKTVGMLQAAEDLISSGHKVAYARMIYWESGFRDVNSEMLRLAGEGFTHFFINEAPYLSSFLTESEEWADVFVPVHRIKIVISGTNNFALWLAMNGEGVLYHRYVRFSTNLNTYPEFKRVCGKNFNEYKTKGGIFLSSEEDSITELMPDSQVFNYKSVEGYIQNAIANNLVQTLVDCIEDNGYSCRNYYTDCLYAVDEQVIFKGIIGILKSTAEGFIRRSFIQEANVKRIPDLEVIIGKWPNPDEQIDITERIARSIGIYQNSIKLCDPDDAVYALTAFLVKIGCLQKGSSGISDLIEPQESLYFAHNALMNYAIKEATQDILTLTGAGYEGFVEALKRAAEGAVNVNMVYFHLLLSVRGEEKMFRYRDPENRKIDAVIIDREAETLILIEVKNKTQINAIDVLSSEAEHLLDAAVLRNISIGNSFSIARVIIYNGKNSFVVSKEHSLLLINVEDFLEHHKDIGLYLDQMLGETKKFRKEGCLQTTIEEIPIFEEIQDFEVIAFSEYILSDTLDDEFESAIDDDIIG